MNHIHYLSDNLTVCQKPRRLGYDFVVQGTKLDKDSCNVCSDLLFAHNLLEFKNEHRDVVFEPHLPEDRLAPAKGLLLGISISSAFWVVIFILSWVVFR